MENNDQQLVAEYLAGDKRALTELIEQNMTLIYRYALRLAQDSMSAEDITQETFVKLWRNLKKYNPQQSFRTWLLSIAHNTALDLLRKRKDFIFSELGDEVDGQGFAEMIPDPAPLPSEIFARAEQGKLLESALAQLSASSREIVILYHESGLTFAEIGVILGKPLNTVKSQYRRALLSLRKILEG